MLSSTITVFSGQCKTHKVMLGAASVDGKGKPLVSASRNTSKPEMVLKALIAALKTIPEPSQVTVLSSESIITVGILEWMPSWKANSWRKSSGELPSHLELWMEMDQLLSTHKVKVSHIKGADMRLLNLRLTAAKTYADFLKEKKAARKKSQ